MAFLILPGALGSCQ